MKLLGIISVDFNVKDQLPIRRFVFIRYWRENGAGIAMRQCISYLDPSRKAMIEL
jgi:hypothetical protein